MTDPDEQVIRFTVKELFLDLKKDLERIDAKLDHKADQAEVVLIEKRVAILETDKASSAAVEAYKKWLMGLVGAIGLDVLFQAAKALGYIK